MYGTVTTVRIQIDVSCGFAVYKKTCEKMKRLKETLPRI